MTEDAKLNAYLDWLANEDYLWNQWQRILTSHDFSILKALELAPLMNRILPLGWLDMAPDGNWVPSDNSGFNNRDVFMNLWYYGQNGVMPDFVRSAIGDEKMLLHTWLTIRNELLDSDSRSKPLTELGRFERRSLVQYVLSRASARNLVSFHVGDFTDKVYVRLTTVGMGSTRGNYFTRIPRPSRPYKPTTPVQTPAPSPTPSQAQTPVSAPVIKPALPVEVKKVEAEPLDSSSIRFSLIELF